MIRVESAFAAAAIAAAALALGGTSAVAAETAVDVPAQVFASDRAGAGPVVKWSPVAEVATQGPNGVAGRSFRLDLPVGARARSPLMFHIFSSGEVCHDNMDFTAAAAVRNQEQDFIRGGDH